VVIKNKSIMWIAIRIQDNWTNFSICFCNWKIFASKKNPCSKKWENYYFSIIFIKLCRQPFLILFLIISLPIFLYAPVAQLTILPTEQRAKWSARIEHLPPNDMEVNWAHRQQR